MDTDYSASHVLSSFFQLTDASRKTCLNLKPPLPTKLEYGLGTPRSSIVPITSLTTTVLLWPSGSYLLDTPRCHPPDNKDFVTRGHTLGIQTRSSPWGKRHVVLSGWSLTWERNSGNKGKTRRENKAQVPRCLGSPNRTLDLLSMALGSAGKLSRHFGTLYTIRGPRIHSEGAL